MFWGKSLPSAWGFYTLLIKISVVARISQMCGGAGVWGRNSHPPSGRRRLRVWEQSLQLPGARGSGGEDPSAGRFLQFFHKNNTFLYIFRANSYFKAIKLKAFKISLNVLNRINEAQVCSIRINVTKYDITFPQKGVLTPNPHPPY